MTTDFSPESIASFWDRHPCGEELLGPRETWRQFFLDYDAFKYRVEPHIPRELERLDVRGKRLLEIGLGQGAEAQQLIEAGAQYHGVDLTAESVRRVRLRCELFDLPYEGIERMNAEALGFDDDTFEYVFSHGVIHHSPRIERIVAEIHRVLAPGGRFCVMLYHRNSVNYRISIALLRRAGIFLLFVPGLTGLVGRLTGERPERLAKHREALKRYGLGYLRLDRFLHKSTDGPDNAFSSVFSEGEARKLFESFEDLRFRRHYVNERHFPVVRHLLPSSAKRAIAERWGWHLWVEGRKPETGQSVVAVGTVGN